MFGDPRLSIFVDPCDSVDMVVDVEYSWVYAHDVRYRDTIIYWLYVPL